MKTCAILVTLLAVHPGAQAKVYVCDEGGAKVFRDQPCAEPQPAPQQAKPAPLPTDLPHPAATVIPIFGQVVAFTLPAHWKPVHQRITQTSYIAEFVPGDQTAQTWQEMITVQGFRGYTRDAKASPMNFLATISSGMEKICGADLITQSLGAATIDSFEAQAAIIGCAALPRAASGARRGQGEVAYYLALRGTNDLYVIQRAIRGGAFDKRNPPITEANVAAILASLQPVKICELAEERQQCASRKAR